MSFMNESEWLTSNDPALMVRYVHAHTSIRKLRLFACACCRRIWHLLADERAQHAVQIVEAVADRHVSENALDRAQKSLRELCSRGPAYRATWEIAWDDFQATVTSCAEAAQRGLLGSALQAVADPWTMSWEEYQTIERRVRAEVLGVQATLLREVIGNPFRPATVDPAWQRPKIVEEVSLIYYAQDFSRLPALADELEAAGCADAAFLGHCRQPGEHVRGCWVVDLLLGKE
jgi:hypothetical protein